MQLCGGLINLVPFLLTYCYYPIRGYIKYIVQNIRTYKFKNIHIITRLPTVGSHTDTQCIVMLLYAAS